MNLSAVRLPRLQPPPVRRRAEESRAELARLEQRVIDLLGALKRVASTPAGAAGAGAGAESWAGVRSAFVTIASGVETLGDVEAALAADEGRWLSQLAAENPEAGDADAVEYCLDRVEKIRARFAARRTAGEAGA